MTDIEKTLNKLQEISDSFCEYIVCFDTATDSYILNVDDRYLLLGETFEESKTALEKLERFLAQFESETTH